MKRTLIILPLALAACVQPESELVSPEASPIVDATVANAPPPPPPDARTVEEFDTTSTTERAEAITEEDGGQLLGTDIASLGDPARPGFWIETALVSEPGKGRVALPGQDLSVEVELIPSDTGSRLSLATLRVLGVPLTELPSVEVYAF